MPSECDSTWDDFFVWCFGLRHLARLATCPERLSVPSATLAVNTWSRRWPETGDRKRSAEALRSICAPKTAKRASPNAESGRNGAHSVVAEEKHELGKEMEDRSAQLDSTRLLILQELLSDVVFRYSHRISHKDIKATKALRSCFFY